MKKTGRPEVPGDKRDRLVQFYLTQNDAALLEKMVEKGKFRGISTFLTALVEPILQGGLSVESAARSVVRIQQFMVKNGAEFEVNWKHIFQTTRDLFAPPPRIIPDEPEDLSQLKQDLRDLLEQLENQTKTKQKHDYANR
jgi:hypothetical protein